MGYDTKFRGELKFARGMNLRRLALIVSLLEDDRIDLELLEDHSGLKWNGMEKTYDMVDHVNAITKAMCKGMPEFRFVGEMLAQGEDMDDRWKLLIGDDGMAYQEMVT